MKNEYKLRIVCKFKVEEVCVIKSSTSSQF